MPAQSSTKPADKPKEQQLQKPIKVLEEDDEFEDFPAEGTVPSINITIAPPR